MSKQVCSNNSLLAAAGVLGLLIFSGPAPAQVEGPL